jgi:thiosulfate/3-mercaptopyruvate sulfurtransferase
MTSTPVAQRGYARPELLTETDWLAAHLVDPRVRIIDARGPQHYAAAHIPGAVNLDGFGAGIPRAANADMAEPQRFSRIARELGIDNDMTVVVYDAPSQRMGMVAWTFLYYGHQDVRILDGGFDKWSREDRPTATDGVTYAPSTYTAHPVPDIYCSLEDAKAGQEQDDFVFWDTRAPAEYQGTVAGFGDPLPRMGHIPGAVHLEWTELLDSDTKTLKSAADLQRLLASRGITPQKHVASYCQGGARGALAAVVLRILGYEHAKAYAGSFAQWSNQPDTRVERA